MKSLQKKLMLLIALFFLLICWPVSQIHSGNSVAEKFRNNVLQLSVKFTNGTLRDGFGFVVGEQNNKLYVATANHLVRLNNPDVKANEILVRFYTNKGKSYLASLLELAYPGLDIALLEVPRPFKNYKWETKHFYPDPKKNDKVWFIGRERDWYIPTDAATGNVNKLPLLGKIHVDMYSVQPGTSGAPLITKDGIVGMIIEDSDADVVALDIETMEKVIIREWNYPWGLQSFSNKALSTTTKIHEQSRLPSVGDIGEYPITGMEFVWVPNGSFQMGCGSWADDCEDDEKPVHDVYIDGFWIGKYEVTVEQFKYFLKETSYKGEGGDFVLCKEIAVPEFFQSNNHPVVCVSWEDSVQFAQWLTKKNKSNYVFRLPTEAEWEYACRSGGKDEKYCGGQNMNKMGWYQQNSDEKTYPIGRKAPNGLGIYDMSGNVREWCNDWYGEDYYLPGPVKNPEGPPSGSFRSFRGGRNIDPAILCRSTARLFDPVERGSSTGFRLVRSSSF